MVVTRASISLKRHANEYSDNMQLAANMIIMVSVENKTTGIILTIYGHPQEVAVGNSILSKSLLSHASKGLTRTRRESRLKGFVEAPRISASFSGVTAKGSTL